MNSKKEWQKDAMINSLKDCVESSKLYEWDKEETVRFLYLIDELKQEILVRSPQMFENVDTPR